MPGVKSLLFERLKTCTHTSLVIGGTILLIAFFGCSNNAPFTESDTPSATAASTVTDDAIPTLKPAATAETGDVVVTQESPTATTGISGLAIDCTFNPEQLEISCQAIGNQEGSQLTWTSTGSWATSGGYKWQFTIHDELISPTTQVSLEECVESACQTVEASIDTSAIIPAEPAQDTDFQMRLPFTEDHEPAGIMPMGETINHPPPSSPWGHVGIDFQWDHQAPVIAAVDGVVVEIVSTTHAETGIFNYSVHVVTGEYIVNYTTLESVDPSITVGSQVVVGQLIGLPTPVQKGAEWHMIHWDFGTWEKHEPRTDPEGLTTTYTTTRICPVPYFTDSERERLFRIWNTASYGAKDQFPDLCNGLWKNYSGGTAVESTSKSDTDTEVAIESSPEVTEALPTAKPIQDLDFQMRLPFKTGQEPLGMMPMGETILHPATRENPNGHPGIDFQWPSRAEIIAAVNGEVAEIRTSNPYGTLEYSVLVISGDFVVNYSIIDIYSVNPDLAVGNEVVSGQVMGYAPYVDTSDGWASTHWAFGKWTPGSEKPNPEGVVEKFRINYLCPVPYFSEAERLRLFRLWDAAIYPDAGGFKGTDLRELFPDVCNGPYKNY